MDKSDKSIENNSSIAPAMRNCGHKDFLGALDSIGQWAVRYADSLGTRNVSEPIEPGQILGMLPNDPPGDGMDQSGWHSVVSDLETIIEPGLVHWQSPRFFAYFPCSASMPAVLGELISAVLNVNGMLWSTSPSATELEMRMMDWCAQIFGLPDQFRFDKPDSIGGGCIQGTASEAALAALVAARRRKVDRGRDRSTMCIYTSTQAHSSIIKAAMVAGLADHPEDRSRVRLIGVDEHLAMDADELGRAIAKDLGDGLTPCLVSTTQGTTSTGAMDPLVQIGEDLGLIKLEDRPWLHVDAAWAGAAAACPENRFMLDGVERADSLCINPHKWLLTNFDCDLFWVRDRKGLSNSMSITPAYLLNEQSESGEVVDYRDWHVPLGRRMRAIKLWLVIRHYGVEGLRAHIRHHVGLAGTFERFVVDEPRLLMWGERTLGLVCFRVIGDDGLTKELIERVNRRGWVMISHTRVPTRGESGEREDRWVARVAVGSTGVVQGDIDELCDQISIVLDELVG